MYKPHMTYVPQRRKKLRGVRVAYGSLSDFEISSSDIGGGGDFGGAGTTGDW